MELKEGQSSHRRQTTLQNVIVSAGGRAAPNSPRHSDPPPCPITSSSQYVDIKGSSHLRPKVPGVLQWQELGGEERGQGVSSFHGLFFPAPLIGCSLSWDLHLTVQGE